MYRIIATEDFVNMLYEIPLRHLSVLTHSFVSIEKIEAKEEYATSCDNTCIIEMLERMRNQELE